MGFSLKNLNPVKLVNKAADSVKDIPGSISNFAQNPIKSIGTGIGNISTLPGRAIGSDSLTALGGAAGSSYAGFIGGPNLGKAAGESSGTSKVGQWFGRGAVSGLVAGGALLGGQALLGPGATGGSAAGSSGAGTGLMGPGGVSSLTGAPAYAGVGGGAGAASAPFFGGMQGSAAPGMFASTPASSGFLSSLGNGISGAVSGIGDWFGGLSGKDKLGLGLGLGDMALRYKQMQQMNDIANKASEKSDALMQPQRFPYQDLMGKYYSGEMDITQQPIVKAQMDQAGRQMQAYMAKNGQSGGGSAPFLYARAMKEAGDAASQQYLNQLSGVAGFGFGPGYSGNIYGQYASQATGAPSMMLNSLGQALGYTQPYRDGYKAAYNAQQQMMGRGDSNLGLTI